MDDAAVLVSVAFLRTILHLYDVYISKHSLEEESLSTSDIQLTSDLGK